MTEAKKGALFGWQKSYIFKNELDEMANHPSLTVTYLDSRDDLHQEIDTFNTLYKTMENTLLRVQSHW